MIVVEASYLVLLPPNRYTLVGFKVKNDWVMVRLKSHICTDVLLVHVLSQEGFQAYGRRCNKLFSNRRSQKS